jgi:nitroreductase
MLIRKTEGWADLFCAAFLLFIAAVLLKSGSNEFHFDRKINLGGIIVGTNVITRQDYLTMDEVEFRARFRERVHHTLEIQTYSALYYGKKLSEKQTETVTVLIGIWQERGLPEDAADYVWGLQVLQFAKLSQTGSSANFDEFKPHWPTSQEIKTFENVLYERRSVRHWTQQEVPDEIIDRLLTAGLWAAHSCNLQSIRYIVIREENEPGLFKGSDIPGGPVHIILLQDERVYRANALMPVKNRLLDCGAAAQNIVLAAHAYGLGGVWLTFNTADMIERLNKRFSLPEHIKVVTYVDVGYPDQNPAPPKRLSLSEVVLDRI